jgi:predicted GNAT family N-acyltransferase
MKRVRSANKAKIEPAKIADLEELTRILDKANEYSRVKSGEPAWALRDLALRELTLHIKAGNCFVMREDQKIMATMTITDEDRLWGETGTDGTALYIHKLMKNPECHARNLGLRFMAFAAHEALKQNRKFIRCDTISNQKRLIKYYFKLGFIEKGLFTYQPSGRGGIFLEAEAEAITASLV